MEVNMNKTKTNNYKQGPKTVQTYFNFTYMYESETVDVCQSYRYLGLVLNESMDYTVTCKCIAQCRALGLFISTSKTYGGMPYECFIKLYLSLIPPILDYGAGIWGTGFSCINAMQHRAERFYWNVNFNNRFYYIVVL